MHCVSGLVNDLRPTLEDPLRTEVGINDPSGFGKEDPREPPQSRLEDLAVDGTGFVREYEHHRCNLLRAPLRIRLGAVVEGREVGS